MPTAYFIQRLSEHYSPQEIAEELGCSTVAVYKLLRSRNISHLNFQDLSLNDLNDHE